jgi:hypothetical protein
MMSNKIRRNEEQCFTFGLGSGDLLVEGERLRDDITPRGRGTGLRFLAMATRDALAACFVEVAGNDFEEEATAFLGDLLMTT